MSRLLIRLRFLSGLGLVLVLGGLVLMGRHVEYEQSLTSFFSQEDPLVKSYERASDLFGNDNFVFIGYDDPDLMTPGGMDRIEELAGSVAPDKIGAVQRVENLSTTAPFWRLDDELIKIESLPAFLRPSARRLAGKLVEGGLADSAMPMTIGALIRQGSDEQRAEVRDRVLNHPLMQGTLVNAEGTSTVVVVHLKGMDEQDIRVTITSLRQQADAFALRHGLDQPALVGPPVLLADGFQAIEQDGRRLAVAGMALIGLVTLTATRSLWWAIAPIAAGWTIWLLAEAVLSILGLKLSLSGGPLVAQIIVLTMPAASHLAIHFRDSWRQGGDRYLAAVETLQSVSRPILWCAITGMVGYGALISSSVVPVKQFGAVLGVCTLLAAMLTLLISPLAMMPPFWRRVRKTKEVVVAESRGVRRLIEWVERNPGRIVLGSLMIVVPLLAGMTQLAFESNYINAFRRDSRVVRDYRFIESRLGGIGMVSLVVPVGPELTMADLENFRKVDLEIIQRPSEEVSGPRLGVVSRVISLASVLDPEGRLAALGENRAEEALATKLDLIRVAPQGELMSAFWNPGEGQARVIVRVPEQQDAITKENTFLRALSSAKQVFGPECGLTGLSYLLTRTTRGVMTSSWSTFLWAAGAIMTMLVLAFRSPVLALLAILPSLLAVGLVLGLTGWAGVKLDIATALVASVALGLAVDDTFHCLIQFHDRRVRGGGFSESLHESYAVTGPGVILSSLAVAAGFAVLCLSQFVPFSNFGMMVGVATLGSSVGNLVLLPACLTLMDRMRRGGVVSPKRQADQHSAAGISAD